MRLHVLVPAAPGEGGRPAPAPLVLLHAFPLDHRMWRDAAAALVGTGPVLAADLPGAGLPVAQPGPDVAAAALEDAADDLARALREGPLGTGGPVVVAGISLGGYVALALLERHPDLVAGLALLDTRSTADPDAARQRRLVVAEEVLAEGHAGPVVGMADDLLGPTTRRERPDLVDQVRRWIGDQPATGVAWAQRAMAARPDRTAALAAFGGPVLVLRGDEDALSGPDAAGHLVAAVADRRRVEHGVVPGAGHLSALERPEAVAAALARLRERVAAGA
nr:alpha/beta fold hydrolase [Cellulomonas endophytica]